MDRFHNSSISGRKSRFGDWRELLLFGLLLFGCPVSADQLVYESETGRKTITGKLAAQTVDELLFVEADGSMTHLNDLRRVVQLEETEETFQPLGRSEMTKRLGERFGPGFDVLPTRHFLVCYNCDREFAESVGRLLENLHRAFTNYFRNHGFELSEPEFPMVSLIFREENQFAAYAETELDEEMAKNVIGYYSFLSNRVVLYDLRPRRRVGLANIVRPSLQERRQLEVNLSTIIHEATHQLAYNLGFHKRFSDMPLWLVEGMAMYFEAPDRRTGKWRGIGAVNRLRMPLIREEYLRGNRRLNLSSLVETDERFRGDELVYTYAESWALTYFLMKKKRAQFHRYLRLLAEKPHLGTDDDNQRMADFQSVFGDDIDLLQRQFESYIRSVR